ncbi:hypothetical protein ABZS77_16390 [Micromonospora sp. NPDC005298]|uniref:hypothetical protein n=1 Tax=Micromonospora sp. NPDC005298 TaxID=3156873 RepID=UPI0033A46298
MNLPTVLDLIADREPTTRQDADRLREQITTLTGELARLDGELGRPATTRATLRILAAAEFTADDPTIASAPTNRSWLSLVPSPPACAPRASGSPSASSPRRNMSKAPARS